MGNLSIFAQTFIIGSMKYEIKFILSVFLAVSFLVACSDAREASSIADVYDAATEKVLSATSSEELVEISYVLHLELAAYGEDGRPGNSRVVVDAKERFKKAVKEKEVEFYTAVRRKK